METPVFSYRSPPHSRGTHCQATGVSKDICSFIPAFAGNTLPSYRRLERHLFVHPRIRGEHIAKLQASRKTSARSSPHSRGTHYQAIDIPKDSRSPPHSRGTHCQATGVSKDICSFTPAFAGNTLPGYRRLERHPLILASADNASFGFTQLQIIPRLSGEHLITSTFKKIFISLRLPDQCYPTRRISQALFNKNFSSVLIPRGTYHKLPPLQALLRA